MEGRRRAPPSSATGAHEYGEHHGVSPWICRAASTSAACTHCIHRIFGDVFQRARPFPATLWVGWGMMGRDGALPQLEHLCLMDLKGRRVDGITGRQMRGGSDVMMALIGQNSLYAVVAEWHLLIDWRCTFPINRRVTFCVLGYLLVERAKRSRQNGFEGLRQLQPS
ncbi:hypothetical protein V8C44DRAFT_199501 [Trichoderma aethiopicum]